MSRFDYGALCFFFFLVGMCAGARLQADEMTVPVPPVAWVWDGMHPDPARTPGAIFPTCTADTIKVHGYTATVRNVTEAMKKEVFHRYGIDYSHHADYEVDHGISLELCGSNDILNLWPQPYVGVPYTARHKDVVETHLSSQVKKGKLSLVAAQRMIMEDWVAVYKACCEKKTKG
jgi:hypothetical protein